MLNTDTGETLRSTGETSTPTNLFTTFRNVAFAETGMSSVSANDNDYDNEYMDGSTSQRGDVRIDMVSTPHSNPLYNSRLSNSSVSQHGSNVQLSMYQRGRKSQSSFTSEDKRTIEAEADSAGDHTTT